jgi:hypothetical protein
MKIHPNQVMNDRQRQEEAPEGLHHSKSIFSTPGALQGCVGGGREPIVLGADQIVNEAAVDR